MRRLLTALLAALTVACLLPLTAFAGVPSPDNTTTTTDEDTAVGIVLTATDDSGADVTDFTPSDASHGDLVSTGCSRRTTSWRSARCRRSPLAVWSCRTTSP